MVSASTSAASTARSAQSSFGSGAAAAPPPHGAHQQLGVLRGRRAREQHHPASQADQDQIEHPCRHKPAILPGMRPSPLRNPQVSYRCSVLEPHTVSASCSPAGPGGRPPPRQITRSPTNAGADGTSGLRTDSSMSRIHGQVSRVSGEPPAGAARHPHRDPAQAGRRASIKLGRRKPGGRPGETGHRTAGRCEGGAGPAEYLTYPLRPRDAAPGAGCVGAGPLSAEADARSGSTGGPERPRLILLPWRRGRRFEVLMQDPSAVMPAVYTGR